MKASRLLNELKENIKDYNINTLKDGLNKDIPKSSKQVGEYNLENYYEIMNSVINEADDYEISDKKIENMRNEINLFFEDPDNDCEEVFKKFIESICLYLSLIAKKPLHPVGMDFGNNKTVHKKVENDITKYYCDVKKALGEKSQEYYTCRYCLCNKK